MATTIWHLLDGERSLTEIQQVLVRTYEVAADQAAADVSCFLDELSSRGLLAE